MEAELEGKRVPKGYKVQTEPTRFPYFRVTDFNDSGSIDMSDLRYVSPQVRKVIKNHVINSSDMYLSIAGVMMTALTRMTRLTPLTPLSPSIPSVLSIRSNLVTPVNPVSPIKRACQPQS